MDRPEETAEFLESRLSRSNRRRFGFGATSRRILKHWVPFVSIGTLFFSVIGFIQQATLLFLFGIELPDYAEFNDLLMAGFKSVTTPVFTIFTLYCCYWILNLYLKYFGKRPDRLAPRSMVKILVLGAIGTIGYIVGLVFFIQAQAKAKAENQDLVATVKYRTAEHESATKEFFHITNTDKYMFFWEQGEDDKKIVHVIPVASISRIEFHPNPKLESNKPE